MLCAFGNKMANTQSYKNYHLDYYLDRRVQNGCLENGYTCDRVMKGRERVWSIVKCLEYALNLYRACKFCYDIYNYVPKTFIWHANYVQIY